MPSEDNDPIRQHRAAMKQGLKAGGAQAVIAYIEGFDSDPLRRALYIALNSGYLGLARWIDGGADGRQAYEAATEAFEAQLAGAARAEEAKLGLGQLRLTRERHGP